MFIELLEALEFKRDTLQGQIGDVSPYVDKLLTKEVKALGVRITRLSEVISSAQRVAQHTLLSTPAFNRHDQYRLVEEPVTLVYRAERVV